jgi:hypothetical protein
MGFRYTYWFQKLSMIVEIMNRYMLRKVLQVDQDNNALKFSEVLSLEKDFEFDTSFRLQPDVILNQIKMNHAFIYKSF